MRRPAAAAVRQLVSQSRCAGDIKGRASYMASYCKLSSHQVGLKKEEIDKGEWSEMGTKAQRKFVPIV